MTGDGADDEAECQPFLVRAFIALLFLQYLI